MLSLSPTVIELWLVFFDAIQDPRLLRDYAEVVTEEEREHQARFHFDYDRRRYLITRALVRTVLSRYSHTRPQQWRFDRNAYGRPEVAAGFDLHGQVSFNLSHTENLILLGVTSRTALGVDAENVATRPAPLEIAETVFSPREIATLRVSPPALRHARFFDYWTLKESYLKARGMGLSLPLKRFSFDFPDRRRVRISMDAELGDTPCRWRFWQLRPSPVHIAAVCAEQRAPMPRILRARKIVPLREEEPFTCTVVRESDPGPPTSGERS
jgi:4'-phosphopantetheinyl transferase